MKTPTLPIDMLKPLAAEHLLSHIILFAHHPGSKSDHIVTFGVSVKDCAQAAGFGNQLKDALGWPASLHQQPDRVLDLQNRIKDLEQEVAYWKDKKDDRNIYE